MIFILEVTPNDADCWSRESESEVLRVYNMLAGIFNQQKADNFTSALAGLSALDPHKPCEVRVYRGIEEARAALAVETDPAVIEALSAELAIVATLKATA